MKVRHLVAAAALGLASFAAQATIYKYTGNAFDYEPYDKSDKPRVEAWFDIDFSQPSQSLGTSHYIKDWGVIAGPFILDEPYASLTAQFTFDSNKNITGWYFNATHLESDRHWRYEISIISESAYYRGTQSWYHAQDYALDMWTYHGAIDNNQGTWTVEGADAGAEVPEPVSLGLLGIGVAGLAAARRRKRAAA